MTSIYLIGSLRNKEIPDVGARVRGLGFEVFDDWFSAGPEADDYWQKYEKDRGHSFPEALAGRAAQNVYNFDKRNLDRCDAGLLVLPAGRSGHLELGYIIGRGKPGFILLAGEPDRFDVMYGFATRVFLDERELLEDIKNYLPEAKKEVKSAEKGVSDYWKDYQQWTDVEKTQPWTPRYLTKDSIYFSLLLGTTTDGNLNERKDI